ncbi:hypothetical protein A3A95_04205 [Candidatus Nomurabacteria bacterium RIFCSPLOWO2_01_FULL_39_18]|uniref:LTD domain-containing protein n=1 Tax=Candidatus Nomurabacteria bacterium RIFCSPHIGHO2_01_FULL_40_24b TaxID=1801739 RepID=A0A1F6V661_9BACT|nr:MAG: hypothetical protein A2647_04315 [Candidatus Nomurabacteria bacterium RIFCSPHIGHO2_01_FULL_40_24b]OGI89301.1 MAG: hypothetical protein A3A95_04205 [Candidatus Nomurabacteria bacterium RIFCSPLOWO2_01_FULL_39_18]
MRIKDKFMKKIIIFSIIFFLSYHFAFAGIEISEIMYDLKTGSDEGREWVEIRNNSDTPEDLSAFKFFEADTNHKLTVFQGDVKVGAQSYAIIVSDPIKFKIDWPNFGGTIFDSSFSLSNSGEALVLKEGDLIADEYIYKSSSGGAGDGRSLQKINGVWSGATPTPGTENKISPIPVAPSPTLPKKEITTSKIFAENQIETKIEKSVVENLPSVVLSEEKIDPTDTNSYLFISLLVVLVAIGAGSVYFIRKKGKKIEKGEDFELLD